MSKREGDERERVGGKRKTRPPKRRKLGKESKSNASSDNGTCLYASDRSQHLATSASSGLRDPLLIHQEVIAVIWSMVWIVTPSVWETAKFTSDAL